MRVNPTRVPGLLIHAELIARRFTRKMSVFVFIQAVNVFYIAATIPQTRRPINHTTISLTFTYI